jgi:hypothetical protein
MTGSPTTSSPVRTALLGVIVAGAVLTIYLSRLDRFAGLMVDDAWYVLLARTLATNEPFGMVNSPLPGSLTPYPPGFPFLLSMMFRIDGSFPHNVWLLKALSIAAMLGVGVASYWYASRRGVARPIAMLASLAIVITPAFVFLATSTVMSECLFTLVQLLAIMLVDASADGPRARRHTLLAGAASAAAVLIRSAGVTVVVAGVAYLLYRRQWRRVLVFTATVLVCLGPWAWYSRAHAPTTAERLAQGGGHALTYGQNFWLRWASDPASGTIGADELPGRVAANLLDVAGRNVAGVVVPGLFRGPAESGQEVRALGGAGVPGSMGSATGTMLVSFALSAIATLGFATLVRRRVTAAEFLVVASLTLTVLWPFWPFRFVLPLTPLLYLYLVAGVQRLVQPALQPTVLRIALLSVIGLQVLDHAQYAATRHSGAQGWKADAAEVEGVLQWMTGNLTGSGYVATTNPALVYLRTGRKTVAIDEAAANWERWKRLGVRYLVCLKRVELPSASRPYTVLYRSPRNGLWIVEI